MTDLSTTLTLERPGAMLRLDQKRLTVNRDSLNGRPERPKEMVSGENLVGNYLCALFALHTLFIRRESTVYYAEKRSARRELLAREAVVTPPPDSTRG